jgi:hypothetical protein
MEAGCGKRVAGKGTIGLEQREIWDKRTKSGDKGFEKDGKGRFFERVRERVG